MRAEASSRCLSENEVLSIVRGTMDGTLRIGAEAHIDTCEACQEVMACILNTSPASLGSGARARTSEAFALPGRAIGKYQIREIIGAGAMGVVYLADDSQLNRQVAVKVLRSQQGQASERLMREARALARVAHPNVIVVHEVGTFEDHVFMAMEFVEGTSLSTWLLEREHTVSEVLAVFEQAGRGLAVAHAAGLVHRDFKPDNVLVGRDGRVRVVDFGLAREDLVLSDTHASGDPSTEAATPPKAALLTLTRTGAFVGTPAYMAPEQYAGARTDARTDQFGFAIALFEALYGRRPFDADTLDALAEAVKCGNVVIPRSARRVPKHVGQALLRALRVGPEERFPTMDAFLAELTRTERRLGARAGVIVTLAAGLVGVAVFARSRGSPARVEAPLATTRATTQAPAVPLATTQAPGVTSIVAPAAPSVAPPSVSSTAMVGVKQVAGTGAHARPPASNRPAPATTNSASRGDLFDTTQ